MKAKLLLILSFSIITILSYSQTVNEYYKLGLSEMDSGNKPKAIQYLDTALMMSPENIDAYSLRGYLKAQSNNMEGAIADFSKIIKIDPENATAYSHRGICNKELGNYQAALKDYDKAIALDKNNAHAYHNRAVIKYYFLSDKKGACKDWDIAKRFGLVMAFQQSEGKCDGFTNVRNADKEQTERRARYKAATMSKSEFMQLLKENNILFGLPVNFVEVKHVANSDIPYHYALKNKDADFELRIYVESLPDLKKDIEKKGIKDVSINNMFERSFLSLLDSISQAQPQYLIYESQAVIPKFNGDIGMVTHFDYPANSEYGKGYSLGTFMVIHKDDVADFYLSFLYNEFNEELFRAAEKVLRFK